MYFSIVFFALGVRWHSAMSAMASWPIFAQPKAESKQRISAAESRKSVFFIFGICGIG